MGLDSGQPGDSPFGSEAQRRDKVEGLFGWFFFFGFFFMSLSKKTQNSDAPSNNEKPKHKKSTFHCLVGD